MKLKDKRNRANPAEVKKRHLFEEQMNKVFWIGEHPHVMFEEILKDKMRRVKDKEEDIAFLKDQLGERKGFLGGRDKRYEYSVERNKRSKSNLEKELSVVLDTNDLDYLSSSSDTSDNLGQETDIDFDCNKIPNIQNSVLLPKNILESTAHTAVGEGITPHQHTALISSVIVMAGGSVANFKCSKSTSYRAAENIISAGAKEIREYILKTL